MWPAVCDDESDWRGENNGTPNALSPPCASLPVGETPPSSCFVPTRSSFASGWPPPPRPPRGPSGPEQLLDQVARHAVEEEAQHDEQQQRQHHLDDQPLVAVAHQVADSFQWAQEPQEGSVRATGGGGWRNGRKHGERERLGISGQRDKLELCFATAC